MELTKKDKKAARETIEKGLQREYINGLKSFEKIIYDWKSETLDNRTAYLKLYKRVVSFDKHIGRRYDYVTGSKYIFTVASQLADGVITENDLNDFSPEAKAAIKFLIHGE